jgi:hypothetical protein
VDAIGDLSVKTRETGFLREYFARARETRKNPVSDHPCKLPLEDSADNSAVETASI